MTMNNKQNYLHKITDIVVGCCASRIDDTGVMSITREDVLGKSREENVVMTRCILVMLILGEGYSVSTLAQMLHRTPHAIRNLQSKGCDYLRASRAFRIANAEATIKVEKIRNEIDIHIN